MRIFDQRRTRPDNPKAWCTMCGQDFSSDKYFDDHRRGKHAYPRDENHPDGRHCLEVTIMSDWEQDKHGRWRRVGEPFPGVPKRGKNRTLH